MMNPRVTRIHEREARWRDEFAALRRLCLATGLHEDVKWGNACYDLDGRNVVLIHGFKAYCALLFLQGALLEDPAGILVRQTPTVQAPRQLRFTSASQVRRLATQIRALLRQAIALEKAGVRVAMKDVTEFAVPAEFQARLKTDQGLSKAFHALTPGRRKAYLLYFGGAKQSATRSARIERHAARIRQGLGLDD